MFGADEVEVGGGIGDGAEHGDDFLGGEGAGFGFAAGEAVDGVVARTQEVEAEGLA